ncbi:hypothetical protein KVR01_004134 [Diaporthe batatas]|uniref:uncharacterized protein n=1 Tax=Diaporthe batatas TaxID=748121 RepID=UPI001D04B155|nr:uncharacterized protein KVR01_004134 [Diaporthe batatas]KAG8165582.1 hypothetical protein KVR01_004134 [Diaporthe batatas]
MTDSEMKVAIITGGVSGIGLDVVQALAARGGWRIHVFDIKDDASGLPSNCFYRKANVAAYNDLAEAFKAAFDAGGQRLDFVFANAGIFDRGDWYSAPDGPDGPDRTPPEPDWSALETNLKGCMNTVRIGRHYMAQSPGPDRGSIIVTSSIAGIWPSYFSPIYTASKHGVLGFMRTVAEWYYTSDGIRVNALCPSIARTEILPDAVWNKLPEDAFTPLNAVTKVVLMLLDGETITDSNGITATRVYGQAVVASSDKIYLNNMPDFCDDLHRSVVEGTHVRHMIGSRERV